ELRVVYDAMTGTRTALAEQVKTRDRESMICIVFARELPEEFFDGCPGLDLEISLMKDIVAPIQPSDGVNKSDKSYRNNICRLLEKIDKIFERSSEEHGRLGRSLLFSSLDLRQGYHQIPLSPTSREKTAFSTIVGHYEVMSLLFAEFDICVEYLSGKDNHLADALSRIRAADQSIDDLVVVSRPFERVHMDIVGLYPESEGFRYILTVVDALTKYLVAVPSKSKDSSEVARAFTGGFLYKEGTPHQIISDGGREFIYELFENLTEEFGNDQRTITPYHPSSSGQMIRVNGTLNKILRNGKKY
ncbi:uncharacterized protein LOC134788023, partial [Penaeus indicus]|uniref:uncharacterized protein LOC134788023 n=1 Tax=Penaeus indicus TaxID=29960 RepID=UPI00300C1E59